jgi:hypothetical protein
MILTQLAFKPRREKTAMETPPTKLRVKAPERNSALTRNLPSLLRLPSLKDPTDQIKKRRDLQITMATKLRMKIRKRRDLRPNALTLMRRRRESLRNSRMVFVMAMKTSAKGDSSSFLSLLLVMSTLPQLVFSKLKTQKSTS